MDWKLKYLDGDLIKLAKNFDVIGHCCNCYCVMGSGVAPQIKKAFPEAYVVDCKTKPGDKTKLGTISYTENTIPVVVNLYGQFGFGGKRFGKIDFDYDAFRLALRLVKERFCGKIFGFPMMGSGLAGGSWDVIENIIQEEMSGEDVTIVKYSN